MIGLMLNFVSFAARTTLDKLVSLLLLNFSVYCHKDLVFGLNTPMQIEKISFTQGSRFNFVLELRSIQTNLLSLDSGAPLNSLSKGWSVKLEFFLN